MQRARQRELEFYEKAIRDTDEAGTKRKNEEHELDPREAKRRNEEALIMRGVEQKEVRTSHATLMRLRVTCRWIS